MGDIGNLPVNIKHKRKYSVQPNAFTNTPVNLTVLERKIMYLVLNQLSVTGDNPTTFTIVVSDIGRCTVQINDALKRLEKRRHVYVDNDKKRHTIPIIGEVEYLKYKGLINIELHKKMVDYLVKHSMDQGYTSFRTDTAMMLSSMYSQKLYEILSSWKQKKTLVINVDELQAQMCATNKSYGEFKRSCLLLAMKEINEKTEIEFTFQEKKRGRRVFQLILCLVEKEKEAKRELLTQITEDQQEADTLSPGQIANVVVNMTKDYTLTDYQRDQIIANRPMFRHFIKLDSLIRSGAVNVKTTPTRYIASILFKSPKPKMQQRALF